MNGPAPAREPDLVAAGLASPVAGQRRIAILDLIASARREPGADAALIKHLDSERDERAALLIIRHLALARPPASMPILLALYQDAAVPVAIAHAAIVAHDTIAARPAPHTNGP